MIIAKKKVLKIKEVFCVMIIYPKNLVYILVSIFTPWIYMNTYIKTNGENVELHRYFCKQDKLKREVVNFKIADVIAIGFPNDLKIQAQEGKLHGRFGTYSSQEIDFILKDNMIIALNVRPYTKQQIKDFLSLFSDNILTKHGLKQGEKLYKVLKM